MTPTKHRQAFAQVGTLLAIAEGIAQDLAWERYTADLTKTPETLFDDAAHLTGKLAEIRRDWAHHFPNDALSRIGAP